MSCEPVAPGGGGNPGGNPEGNPRGGGAPGGKFGGGGGVPLPSMPKMVQVYTRLDGIPVLLLPVSEMNALPPNEAQ